MEYFFDFDQIVEIVVGAGNFAKEHHGKVICDKDKPVEKITDSVYLEEKSAFSLVDIECQKIIMKEILKQYPGKFGIIAEEQDREIRKLANQFTHQNELPENKYTLLIDPIDGTSNYCSATPADPKHEEKKKYHNYWGVSLAIAYGKEIIAGVIYYPTLTSDGIILKTLKNQGTWINDNRIKLDLSITFSPENSIRVGGAVKERKIKEVFPNQERYGAFVVTFLALLKGGMETPLPELNYLNPVYAYIGEEANPLDIGCTALAYREAGGLVTNKNLELINLFDYVSFDNEIFKINTFFIMSKDKNYSKSILDYLENRNIII